jgi:hypothetical protein
MKHWLSYRQRQEGPPEGRARQVGKLWHSMMERWTIARMADGDVSDEVRNEIYGDYLGWHPSSEEEQDILGTLIWMWDGFLQAGDPLATWTPVEVEQTHLIPLPRIPGQPEHVSIVLKAKIDSIFVKGKRWKVADDKTASKKLQPDSLTRDMDMDDQLTMYIAALHFEQGIDAHKIDATWRYAMTTDTKTKPRTLEDRYWLTHSARTNQEVKLGAREFCESVLDAYARPLDVEPPRSPDKENCRYMCDWRDRCFYARSADRPIELGPSHKPDQVPLGLPRVYKGRE